MHKYMHDIIERDQYATVWLTIIADTNTTQARHVEVLLHLFMQVYQVKCGERHYPVRERTAKNSVQKLCTKGYFECDYGNSCMFAHWQEELMYWKGIYTLMSINLQTDE